MASTRSTGANNAEQAAWRAANASRAWENSDAARSRLGRRRRAAQRNRGSHTWDCWDWIGLDWIGSCYRVIYCCVRGNVDRVARWDEN